MEVRFADGTTGVCILDVDDYYLLLDFARHGIEIRVPVEYEGTTVKINVLDMKLPNDRDTIPCSMSHVKDAQ